MIYKHRKFITLHISNFLLIHCSGSKLNKITIMRHLIDITTFNIKIMMTSFMVTITLYSIHVITIIIIYRRHAIIVINLLIKTWGTKNIIFIKHSIPKLVALHIISIMDIQTIHTSNITIMLIIQGILIKYFHNFFLYQLSTIF